MKLSYIVPVYKPNIEVFKKHVKALCEQALEDWNAYYVLDGECQEARDVLSKYAKKYAISVVEIPHAGAPSARAKGGELADGDILCFFDSDCCLEPGASKMWIEQFEKRPEVGFIYSGYKFFGEKLALDSEPWDPWTLRVRNYISGCFPVRKELYAGWDPNLKSLQDWDYWLNILEKAEKLGKDTSKLGLYVPGYAFSTALPNAESISGQGCTPANWLERVDAVKTKHNLPERSVCVTSLDYKHDGIMLAKLINADYQDLPNEKPHKYKAIIQVGFKFTGEGSDRSAAAFQNKNTKKILFWTPDDINELYHAVSFQQIDAYVKLLNDVAIQYCEDLEAKKLLERAGFKVEVHPLPMKTGDIIPLPAKPKWAFDISGAFKSLLSVVDISLPDIKIEPLDTGSNISDYTGVIHFFPDRTLSSTLKRAVLTGRHVISNVQAPFLGYIEDKKDYEKFVVDVVKKVRSLTDGKPNEKAFAHYKEQFGPNKLLEVLGAP